MTDLDHVEFRWGSDHLDVDADFRPAIHSTVFLAIFNSFGIGSKAENPILDDEE